MGWIWGLRGARIGAKEAREGGRHTCAEPWLCGAKLEALWSGAGGSVEWRWEAKEPEKEGDSGVEWSGAIEELLGQSFEVATSWSSTSPSRAEPKGGETIILGGTCRIITTLWSTRFSSQDRLRPF